MIAYIFTEQELKFLCGALDVRGLAKHQISDSPVTDAEREQALRTLLEKDFVRTSGDKIIVNSGIALLIGEFEKAKRLLIGYNGRLFTAYIAAEISVLLINDNNSGKYMLYPFENEDNLIKWLHENNIFIWRDIRLEDK